VADSGNFFMNRFLRVAMHGVFTDDAIDRKGSRINTIVPFVLDLNHCYLQNPRNKKRPPLAIIPSTVLELSFDKEK